MLGTAKVTKFEDAAVWVKKQVLWLDVAVADTVGVDVGKRPEELIHVQLDEGDRDGLLLLAVLPGHLVDGLWDVLQHQIQVNLVLRARGSGQEIKTVFPTFFSPLV